MDIPLVLFGLANCAVVVYAFDRLGSMIPDSSWGGLYVAAEHIWSWTSAIRSPEEASAPVDHSGSNQTNGAPTADAWDEPVAVIEELSGTPSRWLW
jgi:hypothetical protein